MAIDTLDKLVAAVAQGRTFQFYKPSLSASAGNLITLWRNVGRPTSAGSAPSASGTVCDRNTQGAMQVPGEVAGQESYLSSYTGYSPNPGTLILCDRVVETGGLSGVVTTAQAINTVALPARAAGADDLELWLEVYTSLGATASATVTAAYTNHLGVSGRTATLPGGIPANCPTHRCLPFILQPGDTGVQSVQSLTLGTSTGTAGNFGVVIRKTLLSGVMGAANLGFTQGYAETDLQALLADPCLELMVLPTTSTTASIYGDVGIAQG